MTMSADYLANTGIDDLGPPADSTDSFVYPTYGPVNTDPTTSVTGDNPLAAIPSTESAYGQSGQAQGTLYDPTSGQIVPAASVNSGVQQQSLWSNVLGFVGLGLSTTTAIVNAQKQTKTGSQRTLATTKTPALSSSMILIGGVLLLVVIVAFGRKRG